jgi:drug/metabolite transporter (DMT)-like permease
MEQKMKNVLTDWKILTIFHAICLIGYGLLIKKLSLKLSAQTIMVYTLGIAFVFFVIQNIALNSFKVEMNDFILLVIAGIIVFIANYASVTAIKVVPNPVYLKIADSLSVVILTFLYIWIFKSEFSLIKFIGILLCVAGSFLILFK